MADPPPFRLYGADVSLFSGKARAYLRHKKIPFEEVPATRDVYREVIVPRVGWPVIPVVVTPEDETLQDTSDILDALEQRFAERPITPPGPRQQVASLLLEVYGDEWLVIPAMHYRWNHCFEWVIEEFGKLSAPDATPEEQREIGRRNAGPFAGALPHLGVHAETEQAIESSYEALLADLEAHFEQHPFLFGGRPSYGDFGLIGPLYAHLYRDPYPGELMRRVAPAVAGWVERMQRPDAEDLSGDFLPDDEIPPGVEKVLRRMASEHLPVLLDTVARTQAFLDAATSAAEAPGKLEIERGHDGGSVVRGLPRAIGVHDFELPASEGSTRTVHAQRAVRPFTQWMLQRPLDALASFAPGDRDAAISCLAPLGFSSLSELAPTWRMERESFQLVASST